MPASHQHPNLPPYGRPLWSPVTSDWPTNSPHPLFPRRACPREDGGGNPSLPSSPHMSFRAERSGAEEPRIRAPLTTPTRHSRVGGNPAFRQPYFFSNEKTPQFIQSQAQKQMNPPVFDYQIESTPGTNSRKRIRPINEAPHPVIPPLLPMSSVAPTPTCHSESLEESRRLDASTLPAPPPLLPAPPTCHSERSRRISTHPR